MTPPFGFAGSVDVTSVLVHFRTGQGHSSEWGRLKLNRPATPMLVTWNQSGGDIVDPLNNRTFDVDSFALLNPHVISSFQIMDVSKSEPHSLATIPGVKKVLTDSKQEKNST